MVWILVVGAVIAILNVVLTYTELIPWFRSMKQLNGYTKTHPGFGNWFSYPFRFISLLPKTLPLLLDIAVAAATGAIGFSGGVYGALIGMTIGFTVSLMVKIHRHLIAPRIKGEDTTSSWRLPA